MFSKLIPSKKIMELSWFWFELKISLNTGLHALRTILWAWSNCLPSQTNVTSVNWVELQKTWRFSMKLFLWKLHSILDSISSIVFCFQIVALILVWQHSKSSSLEVNTAIPKRNNSTSESQSQLTSILLTLISGMWNFIWRQEELLLSWWRSCLWKMSWYCRNRMKLYYISFFLTC